MDLHLSFEDLNSAICAMLHYRLLISHRTAKESVLILVYDKQEMRSLFINTSKYYLQGELLSY